MVTGVTRGYKHVSVGALFIIKQLSYPILSYPRGYNEGYRRLQGVARGYRG